MQWQQQQQPGGIPLAGRVKTRVANSGSIMESLANPTWKMDSTNKEFCLEWPPGVIINSQITDTKYLLRPNMLIHREKPTNKIQYHDIVDYDVS